VPPKYLPILTFLFSNIYTIGVIYPSPSIFPPKSGIFITIKRITVKNIKAALIISGALDAFHKNLAPFIVFSIS